MLTGLNNENLFELYGSDLVLRLRNPKNLNDNSKPTLAAFLARAACELLFYSCVARLFGFGAG